MASPAQTKSLLVPVAVIGPQDASEIQGALVEFLNDKEEKTGGNCTFLANSTIHMLHHFHRVVLLYTGSSINKDQKMCETTALNETRDTAHMGTSVVVLVQTESYRAKKSDIAFSGLRLSEPIKYTPETVSKTFEKIWRGVKGIKEELPPRDPNYDPIADLVDPPSTRPKYKANKN